MKLATRRLIDASARLPAADRALLSLWTQRGLDDAAMAQMTGVDLATIAQRRDRIVAGLSTELGLPPQDVETALAAIAQSAAESVVLQAQAVSAGPVEERGSGNGGAAEIDPVDPGPPAVAQPPVAAETASADSDSQAKIEPPGPHSEPHPEPEVGPSEAAQRRRPLFWLAAALVSVAVIVIVIVAATSGGGASGRASVTSTASASVTSAASATVPAAPVSGPRTLGSLPGGIAGATGTVTLASGPAGTQRLLVHVSGLPQTGSDHYEVWLYNSIIDSVALGQLSPNGTGSFTLPAVVARFASIDISRQPSGSTLPSGASLLRTTNPLAAAPH